jgi:hypothetical protein
MNTPAPAVIIEKKEKPTNAATTTVQPRVHSCRAVIFGSAILILLRFAGRGVIPAPLSSWSAAVSGSAVSRDRS